MRLSTLITSCLLLSEWASAGPVLDYIRNHDLNDYALGIAVTSEQNLYSGAKHGAFAYPYLTSFRDSSFTNDWFLIRDGDVAVRWASEDAWEVGVVGRVQTLGLGNNENDELLGIADRKWTLEVGPMVGWRSWPVHIGFKTYAEISDRHNGLISQLSLSLPMEWSRGYLVPSVQLIRQNRNYVDYYYSVSEAEATPDRPSYTADAASNRAFRARWGYALNEKWLLSGAVGIEWLDTTIKDSPIVDHDRVWSARIGLAYNADVFQPRIYDEPARRMPRFELRISAFQDSISTKVARDTSDGIPGFETDIENLLGAANEKTILQVDATVRLGHYHRLEFGYFELGRNSSTTLTSDLAFGDEVFLAGATVDTRVDARLFRAGYSYSLIKDAQKELGVMAGVHFANFEVDFSSDASGQAERSDAGTPLPVVGAHAGIFLSGKTKIGARLQIFRTDFDRYEGSLNYAALDVEHRMADAISIGLGYNYYAMKLSSYEDDVNGYLKVRHHGPTAFFTIGF